MNTIPHLSTKGHPMIDRADAEATLYRIAISAFTYYPSKPTDEPGYQVDEDLDWCLAPLATLHREQVSELRDTILELIINPTADRRPFITALNELAGE